MCTGGASPPSAYTYCNMCMGGGWNRGRGLTGHITILCLKKKIRYSKMLRRLRIMDVLESYHFQNDLQKGSPPNVSFASPLQSRHPSSYPHLWPNSSPATKTPNAATSNAAKTHAPINNLFILNPFFWISTRLETRKNHRPSSRRTSPPAASSPP